MEIERKYLVKDIPLDLSKYEYHELEQGYISVSPVIRIRKSDDRYILTVKSKGLLSRQEYELDIERAEYENLLKKTEGNILAKRRYVIPLNDTEGTTGDAATDEALKIELDVFCGLFKGLIYAEVEFPTEEAAANFTPPTWFGSDVTMDGIYQNSNLSRMNEIEIKKFMKYNIDMT